MKWSPETRTDSVELPVAAGAAVMATVSLLGVPTVAFVALDRETVKLLPPLPVDSTGTVKVLEAESPSAQLREPLAAV